MNSYLIEYNERIIGSYSEYNNAELFILSCYQNNLMTKDATIHCYKMNSCYKVNSKIVIFNNTSSDCDISLHVLTPHTIPESPSTSTNVGINVSPNNKKNKKKYLNSSDNSVCGSQSSDEDYQTKTPIEMISITPEMKLQNEKRIADIEKEKHDLIHKMNLLKLQQKNITEAKQIFDVDLKLFNQFKTSKEINDQFVIPELFINKYKIMSKLFLEDKLDWSNYYYEMKNNKESNIYDDHFITNSYENSFINNKILVKNNKIDDEIYLDI
jgi:hypothetical protein